MAKNGRVTITPRTVKHFTPMDCCLKPDRFSYHMVRSCCWQFGWATNCVEIIFITICMKWNTRNSKFIQFTRTVPFWLRTWWPVWRGSGRVCCVQWATYGPRSRSEWPRPPLCFDTGPAPRPQSLYTAWTAFCSRSAPKPRQGMGLRLGLGLGLGWWCRHFQHFHWFFSSPTHYVSNLCLLYTFIWISFLLTLLVRFY